MNTIFTSKYNVPVFQDLAKWTGVCPPFVFYYDFENELREEERKCLRVHVLYLLG
jgi:hypothetical protein